MTMHGANKKRHQKLKINSDRLLLVEGRDEANLFPALIKSCLGDDAGIQVIAAGGKEQFPSRLAAIQIGAMARQSFRTLGVVRDADDSPAGAFQSVCDHLRNVGYEPPSSFGKFSDASPAVGVFIAPDGNQSGAIETLCRQSVEDSEAGKCVEQYLECLRERNAMESRNEDKSFAHAYLAAMRDPMARVGEGACQGVWNFDSPAFGKLLKFIQLLAD